MNRECCLYLKTCCSSFMNINICSRSMKRIRVLGMMFYTLRTQIIWMIMEIQSKILYFRRIYVTNSSTKYGKLAWSAVKLNLQRVFVVLYPLHQNKIVSKEVLTDGQKILLFRNFIRFRWNTLLDMKCTNLEENIK